MRHARPLSFGKQSRLLLATISTSICAWASPLLADPPASNTLPPVTLPDFPQQHVSGDFLQAPDTMAFSLQEEIFNRRDIIEELSGDSRAEAASRIQRDAKLEIRVRLGQGRHIDELELREAHWTHDRARLSGDLSGLNAEIVQIYEAINLLKLRVFAGENVPRIELQKLYVAVRQKSVQAAEKRVERAQLDHDYREFRWVTIKRLVDKQVTSREESLDELIEYIGVEQKLATETRRLELARLALELVLRQQAGRGPT